MFCTLFGGTLALFSLFIMSKQRTNMSNLTARRYTVMKMQLQGNSESLFNVTMSYCYKVCTVPSQSFIVFFFQEQTLLTRV